MLFLELAPFMYIHSFFLCICCCFLSRTLYSQSCDCGAAFTFVKEKTEKNYAGFSQKVTSKTRMEYDLLTRQYSIKCDTVSDANSCFSICRTWSRWFKDGHILLFPDTTDRLHRHPDSVFRFSRLDSMTLLFNLPSMNGRNYKAVAEQVEKKRAELERTPFLIIDCRNNDGGSSATWSPLKKYLQTQATLMDGSLTWASEDNAEYLLKASKGAPKVYKKRVKAYAKKMKKHPGTFIGSMNAIREQYGPPAPFPQKVVILTNRHCGSIGEVFILWAKQSKKVTIMGEQTAGVVDYLALDRKVVPCTNWSYIYPTSRSNRVADGRALDNIGIAPDIRLDEKTPDWIAFAQQWMKEH